MRGRQRSRRRQNPFPSSIGHRAQHGGKQAFRRTAFEGGLVQKATKDQYIGPSPASVAGNNIEPATGFDCQYSPS